MGTESQTCGNCAHFDEEQEACLELVREGSGPRLCGNPRRRAWRAPSTSCSELSGTANRNRRTHVISPTSRVGHRVNQDRALTASS